MITPAASRLEGSDPEMQEPIGSHPQGGAAAQPQSAGNVMTFLARHRKPLTEWLIWVAIAAFAYSQTMTFDKVIPDYPIGPTGWPRTIGWLIVAGATGQLLYNLLGAREAEVEAVQRRRDGALKIAQRLSVFLLPFVYLYLTPRIGFYVSTPVFIVALMLLLEVRSIVAIVGVTATVYGLILLIFTRFFFVALPNGNLDGFYELNNAIIGIARFGM
jgi:hypothetical protein